MIYLKKKTNIAVKKIWGSPNFFLHFFYPEGRVGEKLKIWFFKEKTLVFFNNKRFFLNKSEEKKAIPLDLPFEEISLWPELSSLPCFRIQGGYPERYRRTDGRTEILMSNIG